MRFTFHGNISLFWELGVYAYLVFMHIICILFHLSHLHSINSLLSIDKIRYDKYGYCVLDDTTSEHSYPIKIGASKVLVAVPNTAQYPRAAASSVGRPSNPAKTAPELAPIAKSGVTSPP